MRKGIGVLLVVGLVCLGATVDVQATDMRACCFEGSTCVDLDKEVCLSEGGYNGAYETSCDQFICGCRGEPRGCPVACCEPDGTCEDKNVTDCVLKGGTPQEEGDLCDEGFDCTEPLGCRVTGGGVDTFDVWDGTHDRGDCEEPDGTNRFTRGGQVGAPSTIGPPSGEWEHNQHSGPDGRFAFHMHEVTWVQCSDPGWCVQARQAPAKQIDWEGIGVFNNLGNNVKDIVANNVTEGESEHCVAVHIEDLGEPGSTSGGNPGDVPDTTTCPPEGSDGLNGDFANCDCPDYYRITIHASTDCGADDVIYSVEGFSDGGNLQIHPVTPHG